MRGCSLLVIMGVTCPAMVPCTESQRREACVPTQPHQLPRVWQNQVKFNISFSDVVFHCAMSGSWTNVKGQLPHRAPRAGIHTDTHSSSTSRVARRRAAQHSALQPAGTQACPTRLCNASVVRWRQRPGDTCIAMLVQQQRSPPSPHPLEWRDSPPGSLTDWRRHCLPACSVNGIAPLA